MRVLWIPDTHAPSHNKRSWGALLPYIAANYWDKLVVGGDFYDMRAVNPYCLGSRGKMEQHRFQKEHDAGLRLWQTLRNAAREVNSDCEVHVLEGNHEAFLRRYADLHPEIKGALPDLQALFPGATAIYPYSKRQLAMKIGKLWALHGYKKARAEAATKAYLLHFGVNLICFHHHGPALATRPSAHGIIAAWCPGNLADHRIGDEYLDEPDTWQQGFAETHHFPDGTFTYYNPLIINGRFYDQAGRLWRA